MPTTYADSDNLAFFKRGEAYNAAWGKADSNELAFFKRGEVLAFIVQAAIAPTITPQAITITSSSSATLSLTVIFSATLSATASSTAALQTNAVLSSTISATQTSTATLDILRVAQVTAIASVTPTATMLVHPDQVHLSGTANFGIDMAGNDQSNTVLLVSYGLNETSGLTVTDAIGAHNGTVQGSPALGSAGVRSLDGHQFIPGYSVGLDGVNDYIDISSALAIFTTNTQVTFSGYFKVTTPAPGPSNLLDVAG